MRWLSKALGIGVVTTLMAVPSFAAQRVVFGAHALAAPVIVRGYAPVVVRPFGFYGPGWYGYWGPGWYYPRAYTVGPATGEVKINTHMKDGSVYVDSGYVGPIDKFKKFELTPGNHDIELRDAAGQTILKQRVQIILDKTVEIKVPA
jgi:hypothetical protein